MDTEEVCTVTKELKEFRLEKKSDLKVTCPVCCKGNIATYIDGEGILRIELHLVSGTDPVSEHHCSGSTNPVYPEQEHNEPTAASEDGEEIVTCPVCGAETHGEKISSDLIMVNEHEDPSFGDICVGSGQMIRIKPKDGEECTAICSQCGKRVNSRMSGTMAIVELHGGTGGLACTGSGLVGRTGSEMIKEG